MKILWIAISAFFIWFYPRQLTHLICFGRHRDEVRVKSKITYYGIYAFWTALFLLGCLCMGSAVGVDSTMGNFIKALALWSDERMYVEAGGSVTETDSDSGIEYVVLSYLVKRRVQDGDPERLLREIVEDNPSMYEYRHLEGLSVLKVSDDYFLLYIDHEVVGNNTVKSKWLYRAVDYRWDKAMLDARVHDIDGLAGESLFLKRVSPFGHMKAR